jgi:hypothetical protein
MPDSPPPDEDETKSDGPLRIYAERLGVDFDAVVERARKWVAENPLPPDLGPEPFNVGKPRPPVDFDE